MAVGLLSPQLYVDSQHHAKELQGLFRESWLFAVLMLELQRVSHIGVRLGGVDVLLQCDKEGKPRAFLPYLGPEGVGGYRKKCDDVAAKG